MFVVFIEASESTFSLQCDDHNYFILLRKHVGTFNIKVVIWFVHSRDFELRSPNWTLAKADHSVKKSCPPPLSNYMFSTFLLYVWYVGCVQRKLNTVDCIIFCVLHAFLPHVLLNNINTEKRRTKVSQLKETRRNIKTECVNRNNEILRDLYKWQIAPVRKDISGNIF